MNVRYGHIGDARRGNFSLTYRLCCKVSAGKNRLLTKWTR